MDNTVNTPETTQQLPPETQEETPLQSLTNKITATLSDLQTRWIAYREQKAREKMQRVQIDVTKQQWGEGEVQERVKQQIWHHPKHHRLLKLKDYINALQ